MLLSSSNLTDFWYFNLPYYEIIAFAEVFCSWHMLFLSLLKARIFSAKDHRNCARFSCFHLEAHRSSDLYLISDVPFPRASDLYLRAEGPYLRSYDLSFKSCGLCLRYCALISQFLLQDSRCSASKSS